MLDDRRALGPYRNFLRSAVKDVPGRFVKDLLGLDTPFA